LKRYLIPLLIFTAALFPVFSADFGLTIDANTAAAHTVGEVFEIESLTYSTKVALWANAMLSEGYTFEFQGSYTFSDRRVFFLELDQLQFNGRFIIPGDSPSSVSFKIGRLAFSDFSGKVFSHKGDGLSLNWGGGNVSISAFGAYTGLLQMPSNSIIMSASDLADSAVDPVPFWGPLGVPRIVEGVRITLPELFAQQTLILSGIFQQDLRAPANLDSGGNTMNTIYAGLGLTGPIPVIPSLFYSIYGYGNFGSYGSEKILSFIAGTGVNYLIPSFLSSRIVVDFIYSSGDADHEQFYEGNTSGYSTAFIPITAAPAGMIFTAQQTNLFYVSGTYSMKPFADSSSTALNNTLVMIKSTGFFRSTTGAISTGGIKTNESGLYLGTEIDISIMARLLSDLGFSINGGVFLPSSIMELTSPQIKASVALSLSM